MLGDRLADDRKDRRALGRGAAAVRREKGEHLTPGGVGQRGKDRLAAGRLTGGLDVEGALVLDERDRVIAPRGEFSA